MRTQKTRTSKPLLHKKLNDRDIEVERYIFSFLLREGYSPSQRDISRSLDRSRASIQFSINKLKDSGRLTTADDSGRSLVPNQPERNITSVPLLGKVAAGLPIEAIENNELIEVPAWMMKPGENYFVLRVQGLSMIDDHIDDNDLVLVRRSVTAKNGDRVVALINNEATLKRFEQKAGRVILHPANETMKPMVIESHQEFRVAGIFSGVLRKVDG